MAVSGYETKYNSMMMMMHYTSFGTEYVPI